MSNLTRLWTYSKRYSKILVLSIVSAALYGLVAAVPTWIVKSTVDDIFVKKYSHLIIPILILFVFCFVLKGFFMYLTSYTMHWVGNKVINDIRCDLFNKIIHLPLSFFRKNNTGQLMSHFLNDVQMIQNAASSAVKKGIRSCFEAAFLIGVAFVQNWLLALMLLAFGPVIIITIRRMGKAVKCASLRIQKNMEHISSMLQETFVGIREIKAFSAENIEEKRFKTQIGRCFSSIMENVHIDSLMPAFIEIIAMSGGCLVFYVATNQVLRGSTTPGQLTSFIAAVLLCYQPIKRIVSSYSEIQYGLAAADRIFLIIDTPYKKEQRLIGQVKAFSQEILFSGVSFGYDGRSTVFDNMHLRITKGSSIGIVGISGTGKSTLCDLLLGFIEPASGLITIDGVNITTVARTSLRSKIGYVGQQPFLFNDSVLANIVYAVPNVSMERVITACKQAHAHAFIEELPDGYDTIVGENGNRLSGGQKQRITIARALLRDPEILIFDEITSSLDQKSEMMIALTVAELKGYKTSIIVSHRPALLQNVDQLYIIEQGKVKEISKKGLRQKFLM